VIKFARKRLHTVTAKRMVGTILKTDSTQWWFKDKSDWWVNGNRK